MKHPMYKKAFFIIAFGAALTFSCQFAAEITGKASENTTTAENTISTPLPSVTPTPGIQPLDDLPSEKTIV